MGRESTTLEQESTTLERESATLERERATSGQDCTTLEATLAKTRLFLSLITITPISSSSLSFDDPKGCWILGQGLMSWPWN
jgi:hypothetical protein